MATDQGTTEPAPKKTNWLLWVGCGVVILLLIACGIPIFFCGGLGILGMNEASKREASVDTEAGTTVTSVDLTKAYADNSGSADTKYKDKVLVVSGIITNVDATSVTLEPGSVENKIVFGTQCSFSDKHKGDLATLKSGETVKIKGYCTGQNLLPPGPGLSYCKVEK